MALGVAAVVLNERGAAESGDGNEEPLAAAVADRDELATLNNERRIMAVDVISAVLVGLRLLDGC